MTKITDHEDFILTPPATVAADILQGQRDGIWKPCAAKLGWQWSPAHNGYINEGERIFDHKRARWGDYRVEDDAEEACFTSGVETLEQALAVLA